MVMAVGIQARGRQDLAVSGATLTPLTPQTLSSTLKLGVNALPLEAEQHARDSQS